MKSLPPVLVFDLRKALPLRGIGVVLSLLLVALAWLLPLLWWVKAILLTAALLAGWQNLRASKDFQVQRAQLDSHGHWQLQGLDGQWKAAELVDWQVGTLLIWMRFDSAEGSIPPIALRAGALPDELRSRLRARLARAGANAQDKPG